MDAAVPFPSAESVPIGKQENFRLLDASQAGELGGVEKERQGRLPAAREVLRQSVIRVTCAPASAVGWKACDTMAVQEKRDHRISVALRYAGRPVSMTTSKARLPANEVPLGPLTPVEQTTVEPEMNVAGAAPVSSMQRVSTRTEGTALLLRLFSDEMPRSRLAP